MCVRDNNSKEEEDKEGVSQLYIDHRVKEIHQPQTSATVEKIASDFKFSSGHEQNYER